MENNDKELKRKYREYQQNVSDNITASDFHKVLEYPNVKISKYNKSDYVTYYDLDGKVLLEGFELSTLDFSLSLLKSKNQFMIKILRYDSGNGMKVGIFDRNGFMLVDDLDKYYINDKHSHGRKVLDDEKLKFVLDCYRGPYNGLIYKDKNRLLLSSVFDRDNVMEINLKSDSLEGLSFFPLVVYPTKVLGWVFDGASYKTCVYDIDSKTFDIYDYDIDQINGNLMTNRCGSKYYYFDDRSGTILDITDKFRNSFFDSNADLISLDKPILTFDEFKSLEELREKENLLERKIDEIVSERDMDEEEQFAKKCKRENELNELTSKLGILIGESLADGKESISRFLHKIPITQEQLLVKVDDHFEVSDKYKIVLKLLNLATVDFTNVKVSGLDFSDTNATINPQVVYGRDISNSVFSRMNFSFFTDFSSVKAFGTDFSECSSFINLDGICVDEYTKLLKKEIS